MTDYVLPVPPVPSLAVHGSQARFPIRRIFCVGRNYGDHVREMGSPEGEPPVFFAKPADAVVETGATIPYPPDTDDLHHEAELVVVLGRGGRDIAPGAVMDHLWGAACGIDLTRRDRQAEAKKGGKPWDMAKGFDLSAPIGPVAPMPVEVARGRLRLTVNGETRQDADLSEMIWPVTSHVAHLSRTVELRPGDVVMTGTPAGVAALVPGDVARVEIDGLPPLEVTIGPKA